MKIKEIISYLFESYPVAQQRYVDQGGNPEEVKRYLGIYKDMYNKNLLDKEHKKDIAVISKEKNWPEFKQFIDKWEDAPSKSELKKISQPEPDETITIDENNEWIVVIPLSHRASCVHGRRSDWCTTKPMQGMFSSYVLESGDTLIYALHKDYVQQEIDGMAAIRYDSYGEIQEIQTKDNKGMSEEDFKKLTGFDAQKLVAQAENVRPTANKGYEKQKTMDPVYLARQAISNGERATKEEERIIMRHPIAADYAIKFSGGKRWRPAEKAILANEQKAREYLDKIIKGRWPAYEEQLLKRIKKGGEDNNSQYEVSGYLDKIPGERWPEYEEYLLNQGERYFIENYIRVALNGNRWPEYERKLLDSNDHFDLAYYAKEVIKGRWPEYERLLLSDIKNNGFYLSEYQREMLDNKPWPEYKNLLLSNENLSPAVAYILHGQERRWPDLEKEILRRKDTDAGLQYVNNVTKDRWPELEQLLLPDGDIHELIYYAEITGEKWPELEKRLLKDDNLYYAIRYSRELYKEGWPELEEEILRRRDYYFGINYAENYDKKWPELEKSIIENKDKSSIVEYAKNVLKRRWPEGEKVLDGTLWAGDYNEVFGTDLKGSMY